MNILSHRGYWKSETEKNTVAAFERSFALGFGTETDVRDCAGELVISHDMPKGGELTFDAFLDIVCKHDRHLPLALNIKADGVAGKMAEALAARDMTNWFTFDMSVPDAWVQLKAGLPAFARLSEFEPVTTLTAQAKGIWLDAFEAEGWYSVADIETFLSWGKRVCIVSPELHKRRPFKLWQSLRDANLHQHSDLLLCTDLPERAQDYFNGVWE